MLKLLPAMRETWVQSMGQKDPLEKEMATHSSNHSWRITWMEEPSGLQSTGTQKSRTPLSDLTFTFMYGCESWTLKKAEHQRIDAVELNCGVGEES